MPNAIAVPRRRKRSATDETRQIADDCGACFGISGIAGVRASTLDRRVDMSTSFELTAEVSKKVDHNPLFGSTAPFDAQAGLVPARDVLRLAQYDRVARVSIPLVLGARSAPNSTADVVATNPRGFSVPRMGNRRSSDYALGRAMPSFSIREYSVDRFRPSRRAAPRDPPTTQFASQGPPGSPRARSLRAFQRPAEEPSCGAETPRSALAGPGRSSG